MPAPPLPRRRVRTRTRPAAASNVVQFRPRTAPAAPEPPPTMKDARAARAQRCGLGIGRYGTVYDARTGEILFEVRGLGDGFGVGTLLSMYLSLYEVELLRALDDRRGESR
jgi:hypothetical protein